MDLATRKRFHSTSLDAPHPKIAATTEQPTGFANMMTVQLLNALNIMESSQRVPLLDDLISRLQWLKQQHQQLESSVKKPSTPEKTLVTSPRQDNKSLDPQQMQINIMKQQEMLLNMSKAINLTTVQEPPRRSPVPPPLPMAAPKWKPPIPPQIPQIPQKTLQAAEEMMMDLQQKQSKLLQYISSAHGGKVTDDVLHEYLKHPYVLLKENGVVTPQVNPFYHLMGQPNGSVGSLMPPAMKMMFSGQIPMAKTTLPIKPTTPIPAPPVLIPQVDTHTLKKDIEPPLKKENTSPVGKVSPPPQLPRQVALDPPATRQCNQWSVFSMALPLRLLCKCYMTPCRCQ